MELVAPLRVRVPLGVLFLIEMRLERLGYNKNMEDRFIILVYRGSESNTFFESFDQDELRQAVSGFKADKDVEHIEVISLSTYSIPTYLWSNPNSNPE